MSRTYRRAGNQGRNIRVDDRRRRRVERSVKQGRQASVEEITECLAVGTRIASAYDYSQRSHLTRY